MNRVGWPSSLGINAEARLCPPVSVHEPSGGRLKKNGGSRAPSTVCRCEERPLSHDWAAVSFVRQPIADRRTASTFRSMSSLHVLVVGADPERRRNLSEPFRAAGMAVFETGDAALGAGSLAAPGFDAVLIDLAWPSLDRPALRAAIAPTDPGPPDSLAEAERRHIARMLRHTGGNRRQAALLLGISRSTLLHKIRKYRLE